MIDFVNNLGSNVLLSVIISFIGGIISSFSPCMLSTVPLIIGYMNIDNNEKRKNNLGYSIVFSLGMIVMFILLGIVSTLFGKSLKIFGGFWYILLGIVLVLVSLQLFNVFSINKACRRPILKKSLSGAFFLGLLGGFFESPCSTPILIAILTLIAKTSNIFYGIILMLFYSIGHCAIIIIAGISADLVKKIAINEKYTKVNNVFKVVFGVICLIFALYLFYLGF